jgi:HEPN superfamily Swt1-like protein
MSNSGRVYEFVFRGLLTDEALDHAGRCNPRLLQGLDQQIASRVPVEFFDESLVVPARQMATVYTAVAAFENSARKLIGTVLLEKVGENWWEAGVSEKIRKRAESRRKEEEKIKWHALRGASPIIYTDLADLGTIIRNNWQHFEPYVPTIEWATNIFDVIERSRNVIMHSGTLSLEDVERVGINIRDWIKQVGA